MSRAFVRNDAEDDQVVIPARAPLPPGAVNYVTRRGLALLRSELATLEAERTGLQAETAGPPENKRRLTVLAGRIAELAQRIASAQLVAVPARPWDKVRFGATVTLREADGPGAGEERRFRIVGVDEAAAAEGRIAFTAPLARVILGLQIGDSAVLETAQGAETLEIVAIGYDDDADGPGRCC